jgi:hypothetical protein
MNRITFSEDKRGNFRIIYNTVEEIERTLSENKYKYWFMNKYSKVKMYKKDDKEAIKNAIMKFAIIDEAPAFPEIFFQKFNDKIKIVFDYDIKVVECMKNIPGSKFNGKTKDWEIDSLFVDELKEKIQSLNKYRIVEKS